MYSKNLFTILILACMLLIAPAVGIVVGDVGAGISSSIKTSNITINVYSDGVVVSGVMQEPPSTGSTGSLVADIDVGKDSFTVRVVFDETNNYVISSPQIKMNLQVEQTIRGEKIEDQLSGQVSIADERGSLDLNIEKLWLIPDTDTLMIHTVGTLDLTATGDAQQIIAYLPMLNKATLTGLFEEYNITGITINTLEVGVKDKSSASISFDIAVNTMELYEKSLDASKTQIDIKPVMKKLAVPGTLSITMMSSGSHNHLEFSATVKTNINTLLKNIVEVLKLAENAPAMRSMHPAYGGSYVNPEQYKSAVEVLDKFASTFAILPSNGHVEVTSDTSGITISFRTPKITTKSPENTLKALHDFVTYALEKNRISSTEKYVIANAKVTLVPAPGVKVYAGNKTVTTVSFSDLPSLEVEVTAPHSYTASETTTGRAPSVSPQILIGAVATIIVVIGVLGVVMRRR